MMALEKKEIKGTTPQQLLRLLLSWEEKPYRLSQIMNWLYRKRVSSWEEMTDLSLPLRERLRDAFCLHSLQPLCTQKDPADGTLKFLFALTDGEKIETVLLEEETRATLCLSTQVGCAIGCPFCASGLLGLKRSLTPGEIVDQLLQVLRLRGDEPPITNLVLMGMGEPLANYQATLEALALFQYEKGLAFGPRKLVLSTSGLAPMIRRLAQEEVRLKLAISLHSPRDEVRDFLVPINRKYPLEELLSACSFYQRQKKLPMTFEYAMIDGLNDSRADADLLASCCRRVGAKVHLFPFNTFPSSPFKPSAMERIYQFQERLRSKKVLAFVRQPRGAHIAAACGQLAYKGDERGKALSFKERKSFPP